MTSRMKISDRFILDGESIKPKYSQKHVDSMMGEFKGILEMENKSYIRNKAYRKFKKEVKDKGMVYEHREVVLDFK